MQGGVALVFEVGVLKELGVGANYPLHEEDIVEEDGSPEAGGGIDPDIIVSRGSDRFVRINLHRNILH